MKKVRENSPTIKSHKTKGVIFEKCVIFHHVIVRLIETMAKIEIKSYASWFHSFRFFLFHSVVHVKNKNTSRLVKKKF